MACFDDVKPSRTTSAINLHNIAVDAGKYLHVSEITFDASTGALCPGKWHKMALT